MEETTADSSDDEVVAPSQVTAREGAGNLGGLGAGAPGQALAHLCSCRPRPRPGSWVWALPFPKGPGQGPVRVEPGWLLPRGPFSA